MTEPVAKDAGEITVIDFALVLAENLRVLILLPLVAGLAALGLSYLIAPTYTASTRILPPLQQQSASAALAAQFGALAGLAGAATGIKSPSDQYVAFLKSRTVADSLIARFKLKELYATEFMADARNMLAASTTVYAGDKDGLITIEVEDKDPKRAADLANAYVDELGKLARTLAVTEAGQRRLFFEAQLKQAKDNLVKAEIALRGSGISEATLKTVPQSTLEALARIKAQITAQEIKIASMRLLMTESNPDFRLALEELAALRKELLKWEQKNTGKAANDGNEYVARFRDFKYHETLFDLMAKQYEVARLDEAREGAVIQVLDHAQPPERKSKPKKALIAVLTTLAAFFLVLVLVLIRHAVHNLSTQEASSGKLIRLRQLLGMRRA